MALGKLAMRATCRIAAAVVCAALVAVGTSHSQDGDTAGGLTGRLLVATPDLRDPNFSRTVIYIVEDGPGGTIGFIVNRPLGAGPAARVLELFGVDGEGEEGNLRVHLGGPVEPSAGSILHSPDYVGDETTVVDENFALSTHHGIVRAIARGEGPQNSLIVFGYAGWAPGQLDAEMAEEAWVDVPGDVEIVFDRDIESKWQRALDLHRVDL